MLLSKAFIGQKAEELNFNRDTLEKVFRLTEILNFLNTDTLTKDCLALKGGTASACRFSICRACRSILIWTLRKTSDVKKC